MDSSCCTAPGAKQSHVSEGHVEEIAGANTYKTGNGKSAIVLFTDIFGFSFVNTRKMADRFAKETGLTVLVLDSFQGDPIDPSVPNFRDTLPDWLKKHPPADANVLAERFISTIKGHYQSIQVRRRTSHSLLSPSLFPL
jgi:dienelactone hydrolase